jgi:hypothetical protein
MNPWRLLGYDPNTGLDIDENICTREELERTLPAAMEKAAESGAILELESPSGQVLSLGVSEGKGSVQYQGSRDAGPYLMPVGDAALSPDNGVVPFYYLGSESEVPLRNCITPEQVLPLVWEFFETDARPTSIAWEEL